MVRYQGEFKRIIFPIVTFLCILILINMASERLVCLPRTIFSNLSEQIFSKDFTESFDHSRKYHFLSISTFHFICPIIFAPLHTRDHSLNIKKKEEGRGGNTCWKESWKQAPWDYSDRIFPASTAFLSLFLVVQAAEYGSRNGWVFCMEMRTESCRADLNSERNKRPKHGHESSVCAVSLSATKSGRTSFKNARTVSMFNVAADLLYISMDIRQIRIRFVTTVLL